MIYGYIRVSTPEQNEERQIEALKSFGVEEKNIFTDKISGKIFNRTAYQKLLKKIKPGGNAEKFPQEKLQKLYK